MIPTSSRLLLVFTGWLALTFICSASTETTTPTEEPTEHQRIYYFQHRVLPSWTHDSDGAFFANLQKDSHERFIEVAAEIVNQEFADQIVISQFGDGTEILITFPIPKQIPECYFVYIRKEGDTYRYITLERTEDILGQGMKSVVAEWSPDGAHLNMGPRTYDDAERFLNEVTAYNPSPAVEED